MSECNIYIAHHVNGASLASHVSPCFVNTGAAAAEVPLKASISQEVEAKLREELQILIRDIASANKSATRLSEFVTTSLAKAAEDAMSLMAEAQIQAQVAISAEHNKQSLQYNTWMLAEQVSLLASELKDLHKAFKLNAVQYSALEAERDAVQKQFLLLNLEAMSLAAHLKTLREENAAQVCIWESEAKANCNLREMIEMDSIRQQEEVDTLICANQEMREKLCSIMSVEIAEDGFERAQQSQSSGCVLTEAHEPFWPSIPEMYTRKTKVLDTVKDNIQ